MEGRGGSKNFSMVGGVSINVREAREIFATTPTLMSHAHFNRSIVRPIRYYNTVGVEFYLASYPGSEPGYEAKFLG